MIEALLTLALALYCAKTFIDLGSEVGTAALAAWTRRKAAQSRRAIWLNDHGLRKISVIKVIRNFTGLGLKEAKEASEGWPSKLLVADWPADLAEGFAGALRAEGADVSIGEASSVAPHIIPCYRGRDEEAP